MLWRLRSFPDFVEPCLPSAVERPPAGGDWIHEIKHDGFRLLARLGASGVRLFTRNGHDWTEHFPLIFETLIALNATTCLIDGEAVTCTEAGLADFEGLRNRRGDVHLCAFDLLELDGRDLRLDPLTERRRLLARLVRKPRAGLLLNAQFEEDGPLVFQPACLLGCEGIVSKRKNSRYRSDRSRDWGQDEKPECASGEARGGRGLGQAEVAVIASGQLILKRAPSQPFGDRGAGDYDVLADGIVVGRVMRAIIAPVLDPCLRLSPRPQADPRLR